MNRSLILSLAITSIFTLSACENKQEEKKIDVIANAPIKEDKCSKAPFATWDDLEKPRLEINADDKGKELRRIFDKKYSKEGFNGNVLIAQKDVILLRKTYGKATIRSKNDTLHLDSKFQLASASKTFTSVAILKLIEDGKLKFTDDVRNFFPEFPYENITIELLLSHRSGLPYYAYAFDRLVNYKKAPPENANIIEWFSMYKPNLYNSPNKGFDYNNTNFMLLASIIEVVSGVSYERYLTDNIFTKLQMNNTYLINTSSPEINYHRTYGHEGNRKIQKDFFDNIIGDKGIYTTVDDMYKWYRGLKNNCIISDSLKQLAFTPRNFERKKFEKNYGYGFRLMLKEDKSVDYVYHTGWWKGYSTMFMFSPQSDYVIIVLGNRKSVSAYKLNPVIEILDKNARVYESEEENDAIVN